MCLCTVAESAGGVSHNRDPHYPDWVRSTSFVAVVSLCYFRFDLYFSCSFSFSFRNIFSFSFVFVFSHFFVSVLVLVFKIFFSFNFVLVFSRFFSFSFVRLSSCF